MSNSNTIIRTNKRENPYVMIDKYGLNDERLSWKAKGLLAYLLSKPDDWQIYESDLIKRAKDGRDSVRTAIRELQSYGYISRRQIRNEDGSFSSMEYIVYERPMANMDEPANHLANKEVPTASPSTENPSTGFPSTENPLLLNNDLTNNDLTNMNECMNDLDPILESLATETKKIKLADCVTLYDHHFEEVYAMLQKNFPNQLDQEVISIASDLFYWKTVDQFSLDPKFIIKNPTGWFHDCYKDAISQWKARRYKQRKHNSISRQTNANAIFSGL